ncbi:MAG TPA: hypothetical protein PLE81_00635 [Brevundimonas sp.]|uniref:hypothetical protein n=1 Tax=Brevundimonas sp. TaxID=1871086 RepID=UPI002B5F7BB8|nr:hypothetical protein [Brevundimonas sp.]HRH19124.1 hypothetical protein [Brevundimonas sp.]
MDRFKHTGFQRFAISELPLGRDIYMMDEVYMEEWEAEQVKVFETDEGGDPYTVGYITPVHVSAVTTAGLELSWYPNTYDRFHEVKTFLPNSAFVAAVLSYQYDKRPQLFVKSEWLRKLHLRSNSIFAMIDAVDMTQAIRSGDISHEKVISLRNRLDNLATMHPDISFVSFADSLLLKTHWTAGMVETGVAYNYRPESLLTLFQDLQIIYRDTLGLEIYGVFSQGSNEYYDDPLLHISPSQNHISLNSLGLPFAQISLIENAARAAIRAKLHERMEIYMDEDLFRSLRVEDRGQWPSALYNSKMTAEPGRYYYAMAGDLLASFQTP